MLDGIETQTVIRVVRTICAIGINSHACPENEGLHP